MLIQFTGLSGAGKSTIAQLVKARLKLEGYSVEVIDADVYRPVLCPDLGFSKADRVENIRRLGFVANLLARNGIITILAAINPYEVSRREMIAKGAHVKTVWINCDLDTLIERDTKGLYNRASLPDGHADKLYNLTGVNDAYEMPVMPDLIINTHTETVDTSVDTVVAFIHHEMMAYRCAAESI